MSVSVQSSDRVAFAPVKAVTPAAALLAEVLSLAAGLTLIMGVINYSGCWFWPTEGLNDFFSVTAIGGGPFRIVLWGLICVCLLGVLARSNRTGVLAASLPYLGLFAAAALSTLQGDDPGNSVRVLILWGMMIAAGAAIGNLLAPTRLNLSAAIVFAAVPLVSFVLLVVHPAWALMHFGGKFAVRGLFMHKNTAGAFAAYGCLFLLSFQTTLKRVWVYPGLLLCFAFLCATFSATALGGFTIGLLAWAGIGALQKLKGPVPLKLTILLLGLLFTLVAIEWLLPLVISALGKSQSLNGRATGWAYYWRFFQGHLTFGRGPGAFVTGSSEINEMISRLLVGDMNKSTHNAYLSIMGEVGILGLTLYVLGLLYIIVLAPFQPRANPADLAAAVIAVYVVASGFTEAKETLSPGVGTFLVLICRGAAEAHRWSSMRLLRGSLHRRPALRGVAPASGWRRSTEAASRASRT